MTQHSPNGERVRILSLHFHKICEEVHQSPVSLRIFISGRNHSGHPSNVLVCKKLDWTTSVFSAATFWMTINLILTTCHSFWCCMLGGPLHVRCLCALLHRFAEDSRQMSDRSPPAATVVSLFLLPCCHYGHL